MERILWTADDVKSLNPTVPVKYGRTGRLIPGGGHLIRANATLALVEVIILEVRWVIPYAWDAIAVHLNEGVPLVAF